MPSQEIMVESGAYKLSGRWRPAADTGSAGPLLIAIHGGSFTSRYFDQPGFSLLDRAHAAGLSTTEPARVITRDLPGGGR
jgi:hypothetical protein